MITKSKKLHSKQEEKSMVASNVGYKIVLHIYVETHIHTTHIFARKCEKVSSQLFRKRNIVRGLSYPLVGIQGFFQTILVNNITQFVCGTTTSILSPLFYLFNSSVLFSVFANVTCDIYVRTTSYFLTTPFLSFLLVLLHSMAVICFVVNIMPLCAWKPKCLYITSF